MQRTGAVIREYAKPRRPRRPFPFSGPDFAARHQQLAIVLRLAARGDRPWF